MAEGSGVSAESLKLKITDLLNASHVEIEDMSGGCGQAFSACYTPEQWEKQKEDGKEAVAPGKNTTGEVVDGTIA
ncbi:hypothetical protein DID88_001744 [Monilinia fructigena]|uniref:Uncharacterized protein n=1 Tax=Monilinia fructigena TaxID=38457 RepID=A0A395IZ61_9HELO|nr:hypothetical protein DID88_001744 [Monilinia fructigena]